MPKGTTIFPSYERLIMKAHRDIQKGMDKLAKASAEIAARGAAKEAALEAAKTKVASPRKSAKAKQLKLPGTAKRKAEKKR